MFPDQGYNSLLAYPPDHWSLDFMAEYGLAQGQSELWLGLDGRSFWGEESLDMEQRTWVASTGINVTEIKWNNSKPINDTLLECVYLDINSR